MSHSLPSSRPPRKPWIQDPDPNEIPHIDTSSVPFIGDPLPSTVVWGLLVTMAAMFCYAMTETLSKLMTADFHATQILLVRCLAGFALGMILTSSRGGIKEALKTLQPRTQALRATVGCLSMLLAVFAYKSMDIADAVAIVYSAPLAVTLLVVPILGEKIGIHRIGAVLVGFIGMTLVIQPGSGLVTMGTWLALASMLLYALSNVLTRKIGQTDRGITTFLYTQIGFLIMTLPLQPWVWVWPDRDGWILLGSFAAIGALAQYLLILGYNWAPASLVAPMDYTTILWSAVLGAIVFGTFPNALAWSGIVLILVSGSYITLRETRLPKIHNRGLVHFVLRRRPV